MRECDVYVCIWLDGVSIPGKGKAGKGRGGGRDKLPMCGERK